VLVAVQIVPVTSGQHYVATVGYTDSFQTSTVDRTGRKTSLDALDTVERTDKPQTPAEHEFGHMLDLPHVHCDSNEDECYGVTAEEKADIMGKGSYVSPKAYEPFAELMSYFTGCNWNVRQATARPTSRGPLLGGILGGVLGAAALGLAGGLAFGPVGAIVGALLGAVAGAAAGAAAGTPEVLS
jgi:hypothetical protein